jgi:3-mercaptopyruvate sulfurtransferase SseA
MDGGFTVYRASGGKTDMFEKAGFTDKNQTIICYDTSGVRGAFVAMMFRLAGYADARVYNPSSQAWCADAATEITQGSNP